MDNTDQLRKKIRAIYERKANNPEYHHQPLTSDELIRNCSYYIRKKAVDALLHTLDGTFLDVGCAEGLYDLEQARRNPNALSIGLELARGFCRKASSRAKNDGINNVEFIVADAEVLPFKEKSVTAVLCSEVLEHLFEPTKALNENKRVSKRDVIISVPTEKGNPIVSIVRFILRRKYAPDVHFKKSQHLQCFSRRDALTMFESIGFQMKKITSCSVVPNSLLGLITKKLPRLTKLFSRIDRVLGITMLKQLATDTIYHLLTSEEEHTAKIGTAKHRSKRSKKDY